MINGNRYIKTYCCYNKDEKIRERSSSGGMFYLLAKCIIEKQGVVFGAKFDDEFKVVHGYSDTLDGVKEFMGSKYSQSILGDTFLKVKEYLLDGRLVLFSGTPCQVNGLRAFLDKDYENLVLIDFICHGVPSSLVWKKYLEEISKDKKIKRVSFRNKENGWYGYSLSVDFNDGTKYDKINNKDAYLKGFVRDLYLRPSCYSCIAKGENRSSDITLADFWGIENELPEMHDNKGISAIFVRTDKGMNIFDEVKKFIEYKEVEANQIIRHNPSYNTYVSENKYRQQFFDKINKAQSIQKLINYYVDGAFIGKVKKMIKKLIGKV